ncbi:hypothetical protein A1A1_12842 [Planococcus antarcticus DSM 14505]|uniref:Transposase IS204/IS1001/IS1096/IS1165 DDE domain-containing protein n=2 Tax=Planococcus TaxID=1372 RepID=A0AA87IJM3_9BACL|nr:hypothetical protein A1A1_12842 [Planococcus antarcticus DSM 14505]
MLDRRQPADVTEWLQKYPAIELITRDGSKLYAAAVKAASPAILQVADRWHLLHSYLKHLRIRLARCCRLDGCHQAPPNQFLIKM